MDPVLEITTKIGCKVSCKYCPQEKLIKAYSRKSKINELTFQDFANILNKIPKNVEISFCGLSEPFLNKECINMILHAHENGYRIAITTTLVGFEERYINLIQNIPFTFFYIHLPSDENLEKIPIDSDYINIIKKLSESKIDTRFVFHGKDIDRRVKHLIKGRIRWGELFTRSGNVDLNESAKPKRIKGKIGCKREVLMNVLLPNGDVVICSSDFGMQHVMGNLLENDYASLFTSSEYRKVKRGMLDDSEEILCRYCDTYVYKINPIANSIFYVSKMLGTITSFTDIFHFVTKAFKNTFFMLKPDKK